MCRFCRQVPRASHEPQRRCRHGAQGRRVDDALHEVVEEQRDRHHDQQHEVAPEHARERRGVDRPRAVRRAGRREPARVHTDRPAPEGHVLRVAEEARERQTVRQAVEDHGDLYIRATASIPRPSPCLSAVLFSLLVSYTRYRAKPGSFVGLLLIIRRELPACFIRFDQALAC